METKLKYAVEGTLLRIELNGDYLEYDDDEVVRRLYEAAESAEVRSREVRAEKLERWDSTLLVILFNLEKTARRRKIEIKMLSLPAGLKKMLALAFSVDRKPGGENRTFPGLLERVGDWGIDIAVGVKKGTSFLLGAGRSFGRFLFGTAVMRRVDFLFALEDCGYKALPIVSLISFMVGLILAFVGAVQLKTFGAEIYVASLVTIGMTRIMGAIMTGIIMAGRTGASYAATIGTMQVNEEIDALKTMGIPVGDFLVLPRMTALVMTMPLLTMWADFMGMLGGGFVGVTMLGIPLQRYWELSVEAITLGNFMVGVFHGFVFGIVIAVCGCYYGVYCGRNADSVGIATTRAVVSAIVWMIVMTGIITVVCEVLGI